MQSIIKLIKSKGKIVIIPLIIIFVLISIFIFNDFQTSGLAVVEIGDSKYIEASGTVESNAVSISSEVTGNIAVNGVKEGDKVSLGQIIANVSNTNLNNQYEQAKINMEISQKNVELIKTNLKNIELQNVDLAQQAKNAYLSVQAEYEKVMDGASPDEIKQAEETVKQAEVNLEYIRANLERNEKLLAQNALSQSMFDETQKSYNVAQAQYNTAASQLNLIKSYPIEANVKVAETKMIQAKSGYDLAISSGNTQLAQLQSQLDIAKVQFKQTQTIVEQTKIEVDKTAIKSPLDGIVNSLLYREGEFVSTGKQIAEIYDPNNVEIKAYVSEKNIGHVVVGQDVNIFMDSDSNKTYTGKVKRINDQAEFTPKNIQTKEERVNTVFEIKIEVLNSEGAIKPGMPVDVNIKIN